MKKDVNAFSGVLARQAEDKLFWQLVLHFKFTLRYSLANIDPEADSIEALDNARKLVVKNCFGRVVISYNSLSGI